MAAPTSYTEAQLAEYMVSSLGETATILGLTSASDAIIDAVYDVASVFGVADVVSITDMKALRPTARYYALNTALAFATSVYDFAVDGRQFNRGDILDNINKALKVAASNPNIKIGNENDANYYITTVKINAVDDPYDKARSSTYRLRPTDGDA